MIKFLVKNTEPTIILAHIGAIGISFSEIEDSLKIISLILAIGFTVWKWHHEYKKDK